MPSVNLDSIPCPPRQWQDTLMLSLHNFLALVFQNLPPPRIMDFRKTASRQQVLSFQDFQFLPLLLLLLLLLLMFLLLLPHPFLLLILLPPLLLLLLPLLLLSQAMREEIKQLKLRLAGEGLDQDLVKGNTRSIEVRRSDELCHPDLSSRFLQPGR